MINHGLMGHGTQKTFFGYIFYPSANFLDRKTIIYIMRARDLSRKDLRLYSQYDSNVKLINTDRRQIKEPYIY